MHLWLAMRAFWKALCAPQEARLFLGDDVAVCSDSSHLQLLAALQKEGRLVDFLLEEIEGFDDAQVGAAVREVHSSCRRCLEELVDLQPALAEGEGEEMQIHKGYDASRLRVVGKLGGEPPYSGYVVHRGWVAQKKNLPTNSMAKNGIIAPAEVEVR